MTTGLLLLHGFLLDAEMWEPQVEGLHDALPVLAPNLPGFGGAPLAPRAGWTDAAADLAAEAVKRAGWDRAVVCGLSMGGYVAFSFWRRHKDLVAGLILANTRAVPDGEAAAKGRLDLATRLRAEGNGFLAASPPPLLGAQASPDLRLRLRGSIERQPAEAIARASEAMADRVDSTPDLAGITVPTLVITSSNDAVILPDVAKAMAAQIPGATLVVIDGVGHMSNLEAPDEFNRLVREHLSRCQ
ncbi:MAG: alpha/beta fold hydrolase [Dehalococcoidia bacterium]|nr:MAG: alpha/beta fold hydrolase [Dehalococcoidia bacterium]